MSQQKVKEIFEIADIKMNGDREWDLHIHNNAFYDRVLSQGSLGFGESYLDGWWDCNQLDVMIDKIFRADILSQVKTFNLAMSVIKARLMNLQKKSKAFHIGEKHYDIGNDLYRAMLDKRMVYTCAYWKDADTLDQAQEDKLDLVCRKIGVKPGQRVLDIGCGWGSFAKFAAEKYGAHVMGITVSKEQKELGEKMCEGLPVEIKLMDYRDVDDTFDHIVSLGMFEHVGYKNYKTYMRVAARSLKKGGLFLLHTIGGNRSVKTTDPWIEKYIFPNSMLPSIQQIANAFEGVFVMEDWHNFGAYYDTTLMNWWKNFDQAWPQLKSSYSDRFYRMWKFYLLSCAGSFRARENQLWQIVLSKTGVQGGYNSIR